MKTTLDTLSESEQMLFLSRLMRAINREGIRQAYCRHVSKRDQDDAKHRDESRDLMRKYGVVFDQDDLCERGERFDGGAI
jgi:hypothetical protein